MQGVTMARTQGVEKEMCIKSETEEWNLVLVETMQSTADLPIPSTLI